MSDMMIQEYETVIGIEVHVELATKTKIFCACPTGFGGEPNTRCCPVCMGHPGALPVLNRQAVRFAAMAGLALGCTVEERSGQDRKNYFYPDLPKAYQISQFDRPLCRDGGLEIETAVGRKRVGITRIHIEEDAGKLIHDREKGTLIDCNRCGVPLIEIVSEPDLRSAEEVKAYLQTLRSVIRYTGISECRMNEGSFRADVNVSVRRKGDSSFGERTEIKNLNSFAFAAKAVEFEAKRQIRALEAGEPILRETRRFDPATGETYAMRGKESAEDYRFFPDPDLPDVRISREEINALRTALPELPDEKRERWQGEYGLSEYEGGVLSADRSMAEYFDAAVVHTTYPRLLANLMMNDLARLVGEGEFFCPISPSNLAGVAELLGEGRIGSAAVKRLLPILWQKDEDPAQTAERESLWQIGDPEILRPLVRKALEAMPKLREDYRRGKTHALKSLVGRVMGETGGRADPGLLSEIAAEEIEKEV